MQREPFNKQVTLTVNQEEAKLLRSILDFVGRESNHMINTEYIDDEITFAVELSKQLTNYLSEEEINYTY